MRDLEQTYKMLHVIAHDIIDDIGEILENGKNITPEQHVFIHLLLHWSREVIKMEQKHSHIMKNIVEIDIHFDE